MNDEARWSTWRSKLGWLVRELVHGRCAKGQGVFCLVQPMGPERIKTRWITTQEPVTFDVEASRLGTARHERGRLPSVA